MEQLSKEAFQRVASHFSTQEKMAQAFGVSAVSVHRWKTKGLPELRALQADKYLGVTYKPCEYGFDVSQLVNNQKHAA